MAHQEFELAWFETTHVDLPVEGRRESFDLTDPDGVQSYLQHIGIAGAPHFVRLESDSRLPREDGLCFRIEGSISDAVRQVLKRNGARLSSVTSTL